MLLLRVGREMLLSSCCLSYREVPSFVPSDRCGQNERTKDEIAVVRFDKKKRPVRWGIAAPKPGVRAFARGFGGVGE